MATEEASDITTILKEVIECPSCPSIFTNPKTLPCSHVICGGCSKKLMFTTDKSKNYKICCPVCQIEALLPTPPQHLPNASLMKNLVDAVNKATSTGVAKCQMCPLDRENAIVEWICLTCPQLLCGECNRYHNSYKGEHHSVEVTGLDANQIQDITGAHNQQVCIQHDEQFVYFCKQCEVLLCIHCQITEHSGHKTEFIKNAATYHKEKIDIFNQSCGQMLNEYGACVGDVKKAMDVKNNEMDKCVQDINGRYQEMANMLTLHRDAMIQKVDVLRYKYNNAAKLHFTQLQAEMDGVQRTYQHTKRVSDNGSDVDIITCSGKLKTYDSMLAAKPKSKLIINPTTKAKFLEDVRKVKDIFGNVEESVRIQGQMVGEFVLSGTNGHNGLTILPNNNIVVGEFATSNIRKLTKRGDLVTTLPISGQIKQIYGIVNYNGWLYLSDCQTGNIYAYDNSNKMPYILTLEVRGRPSFTIWNDKVYITSSNEDCVYVLPSILGAKNRRRFATHINMKCPHFISTNGESVVVSCKSANTIFVYDLAGQLKFTYGGLPGVGDDRALNNPKGVIIDRHGFIFIADRENRRIVALSDTGDYCGAIGIQGKPDALALNGDGHIVVTMLEPLKVATIKYGFEHT